MVKYVSTYARWKFVEVIIRLQAAELSVVVVGSYSVVAAALNVHGREINTERICTAEHVAGQLEKRVLT